MYYDKSIQRAFKSVWKLKHKTPTAESSNKSSNEGDLSGLISKFLSSESRNFIYFKSAVVEVCLPLKPVAEGAEEAPVPPEEGNGHVLTMDQVIQDEADHYKSG